MRNLVALLLLLAGAWVGMGEARASVTGACTHSQTQRWDCPSRETASAQAAALDPSDVGINTTQTCSAYGGFTGKDYVLSSISTASATGVYKARYGCTNYTIAAHPTDSAYADVVWSGGTACATDYTWSETSHKCEPPFDPQVCLAHNAEAGFKGVGRTVRGFEHACIGGCDFGPAVGGGDGVGVITTSVVGQPGSTATAATFEFSGNPCQTAAPVKTPTETVADNDAPQKCVPAGSGQTYCVKKDGQQCASASNGRQVCWRPTETGEKTDLNILQKRNPGNTPLTVKTPPPDGTTLTQTGTPVVTTTNVTNNNVTTTTTTTTTNYSTNTGTDAGSTPGTGEPASGTGGAVIGGDSTGAGTAAGDGTLGGLAGADGRTKGGVISAFKTRVSNAPMIAAGRDFFTVSVSSGSCPTWTLPATSWTPAIVMDFWCLSTFSAVWTMIGACCLIAFGWLAFKVGVL